MGICNLAVEFNGLVSKQSRAIPRLAHLLLKRTCYSVPDCKVLFFNKL